MSVKVDGIVEAYVKEGLIDVYKAFRRGLEEELDDVIQLQKQRLQKLTELYEESCRLHREYIVETLRLALRKPQSFKSVAAAEAMIERYEGSEFLAEARKNLEKEVSN